MKTQIYKWIIGLVLALAVLILALIVTLSAYIWPLEGQQSESGPIQRSVALATLGEHLLDNDPDSWLLLLQNSTELRPTGGFVTAFAQVTTLGKDITSISLKASDDYDALSYSRAPLPSGLAGNIGTPYLTIKDANWDPDFATSAATISRLYREATQFNPDAVVAITTTANEKLLELIGPISFSVRERSFLVDSSTVTQTLEIYTDVKFAELGLTKENRKEILSQYAQALKPALTKYAALHPIEFLRFINELVATYDLQLWSNDQALQKSFDALSMSRSVTPAESDALLIVDANVGAFKTDPFVERTASYKVDLNAQPSAELELTYTNTSIPGEQLVTDYHSYSRIYVPAGSILTNADGLRVTTLERHGRTVFAFMTDIPQGASKTYILTYLLGPSSANSSDYSLQVQRQPGSTFTVDVEINKSGQIQNFSTDTAKDRILR